MSWLSDTDALGRRMAHTDGTTGVVLALAGAEALVKWDDDTTSWTHEDDLLYVERATS